MRVIRAQSTDIWRNLAAEEWLLSTPAIPPPVLFLWQSTAAVVIGKNQNPWVECAPGRLEQLGIRLARRVSGGGAVYHDLGSLNYAFVVPRAEYRRDRYFNLVLSALEKLGIAAGRMGRSSLGVQGRKISGNAFCYRRDRVLHHGTLLISADLDKLEQALTPPPVDIRTRAIRSERSPVMNLAEVLPGLTVNRVADALADGLETVANGLLESPALEELEKKHGSAAWRYESTPPFEVGVSCFRVRVEQGHITEAVGLDARRVGLAQKLVGCAFNSRDMAGLLKGKSAERIRALGL